MYYLVFVFFLLAIFLIARVTSSPFGKILFAIKENEPRAISLGYEVDRFNSAMEGDTIRKKARKC